MLSDLDQSDIEKFEAVIDSGEYTGQRTGGQLGCLDADGDGLPGHFISDDSLHLLCPLATVFNNGGSFVERYHGMENIPPEHRIFAYPKLNIREQMTALLNT